MYLDQNILRLMYGLGPDDDISEVEDRYALMCVDLALNCVMVMEALEKKSASPSYAINAELLKQELEQGQTDLDTLSSVIELLIEEEQFNEFYEEYLDEANEELLRQCMEEDPELENKIKEYIKELQNDITKAYYYSLLVDGE